MRFDKPGYGVNTTNPDQDRRPLTPFEQAIQDQITNAMNRAGRSPRAPAVGINPDPFRDGTAPNHYLGGVDREGINPGALGTQSFQRFPEMDVSYKPGGGNSKMTPIEAYIRQAAQARGIDPEIAVRVARSEGGLNDPFRQAEGMVSYGREQSYGPFQLHIRNGGVGERAIKAGIDPRKNWQGGVDYALNEAVQKGWGQWFGAAKAGVSNRAGLGGASAADVASPLSPGAQDFVLNNPQPGGFGPGVPDPNSPLFGSMAPGGGAPGMMAQDNSIPMFVANHVSSLGEDGARKPNGLERFGAAISAATKVPPARINGAFGGDARQSGDLLMKALQNPQALAQMLMQRRLG